MNLGLADKAALVTGASRGIGAAIARTLAAEGAVVAVHGRDRSRVEAVVAQIRATGGTAWPVTGDLSEDQAATEVATSALRQLGKVDILVNCAGTFTAAPWLETDPQTWLATYNANVVSAVRLVRLLVPQMVQRGWGRVIQITSGAAYRPRTTGPDYAASKAALVNLTLGLAASLAGSGITVNAVSPGLIVTEGVEAQYRAEAQTAGRPDDWQQIERHLVRYNWPNATGRLGRVEEVAALVAFVASPLAGFIHGAHVRIDGGAA